MKAYTILKDEKHYNLNGLIIVEVSGLLFWVDIGEDQEFGGLEDLKGLCSIDIKNDVLIINNSGSKLISLDKFSNITEAKCYIDSLPKWEKTKYYLRIHFFGHTSALRECRCNKFVNDLDKTNEILEDNGFKRLKFWSKPFAEGTAERGRLHYLEQ